MAEDTGTGGTGLAGGSMEMAPIIVPAGKGKKGGPEDGCCVVS